MEIVFRVALHIYRHLDEYKVGFLNLFAISVSFLETSKLVEKVFQIILLLASIVFTVYKILELHDKRRNKKEKDEKGK